MPSVRTSLNSCSHPPALAGICGILPDLTMFLLAVWTMGMFSSFRKSVHYIPKPGKMVDLRLSHRSQGPRAQGCLLQGPNSTLFIYSSEWGDRLEWKTSKERFCQPFRSKAAMASMWQAGQLPYAEQNTTETPLPPGLWLESRLTSSSPSLESFKGAFETFPPDSKAPKKACPQSHQSITHIIYTPP